MLSPHSRIVAFLFRWGPVIFWLGLIFVFSAESDPYSTLPTGWESYCLSIRLGSLCQDEMLGRFSHVSEYAILGLFILRAVFWKRRFTGAGLLLCMGLALASALLDEIHQLFVPGRTFQLFDLGLDGLGILLACLIFILFRVTRKMDRPQPR
jgi:VanZ family protein